MKFIERSYSGQLFRPTPEVEVEEGGSFGVISTPWGARPSASKVNEIIRDHVLSASQDDEATSPFQKLSCISPLANTLRVATMLANDTVYREDNRAEYMTAMEFVVFSHIHGEFAYAQVGQPNLYLAREGLPWLPIAVQLDLSTEMSTQSGMCPPLPGNLIGIHTTTNMVVSSFRTKPKDKIIFLSHSLPSQAVFTLPYQTTQLDEITRKLSADFPNIPFWLGVLEL